MGEGRVLFWVFMDGLRHCEARRNAELSDGECYRPEEALGPETLAHISVCPQDMS